MRASVFRTIRVRLLAVVLLVCVVMLSMVLWSMQRSHEHAHWELFEAYDPGFAALLLGQGLGNSAAGIDVARADATLQQMGGLNPAVDLYWVDQKGTVLASSTGLPVSRFGVVSRDVLATTVSRPDHRALIGVDPKPNGRAKPVAIEPVEIGGVRGYLYIVLKDLSLLGSISWVDLAWLVGCWVALTALASHFALRGISDPLTRLARHVESLDAAAPMSPATHVSGRSAPTEIARLEQGVAGLATRIAQQVQALRAADDERRVLFAGISHDLRTPISSLSGYLETVASRDHLGDEERKRLCAISLDETKLLLRLLDDLMDLARLESPEMKTDREPFPLAEAVTAVQRRLETAATAKGIVLLVPTGLDASPPLDADPVMVERLLGNVIQNGIEHSPPGGVVRLDVKLVGAWAEVQVTDTGPGIAADQIGLVFERFFRGDRGTQPAKGGMGLGLAIAKRIVELHGGEIRARSPPGGGATFRFTLPLVSSVSESISFPAESPMNTTRREHDRGIA